jgi:hypothetical protein
MLVDRLPDKREILVDQIRDLREDAIILPNEADRKVYIIRHADNMNTAAQNAILKLLEEPPSRVCLLLEAENPAALLATVRSRCIERRVGGPETADLSAVQAMVDAFYGALSDGPLALATFTFSLEKLDRNKFIDFIDGAKAFLTSKLRGGVQAGGKNPDPETLLKAVSVLSTAGDYFNANVAVGHILGLICAELP